MRCSRSPGRSPTQKQPNVYPFGTTYRAIYEDLKGKDPELCAPAAAQRPALRCNAAADAPRAALPQLHAQRLAADAGAQHGAQGRAGAVAGQHVRPALECTRQRIPSHALPPSLSRTRSGEEFDVVVAFEERVFEQIIDGARRALRVARRAAVH